MSVKMIKKHGWYELFGRIATIWSHGKFIFIYLYLILVVVLLLGKEFMAQNIKVELAEARTPKFLQRGGRGGGGKKMKKSN
jgi:hypothetical protein